MDLFSALEIRQRERIALVGSGGKTSLAYRLVEEAQTRGWTALFSTTTKLVDPVQESRAFVLLGESATDLDALRQQLSRGPLYLAKCWLQEWDSGPAGRRQKVGGFGPEETDQLAQALQPDLLVIEADGSKHRPFKAPATYEPVIPASTTLLVALAGLSVLGRPLDPAWVHRPERVTALAQVRPGTTVDPALIATVLAHPEGGLKKKPPAARAVALLTQVTPECHAAGREIARRLLHDGAFAQVLLANLDNESTPVEVWPDTGQPAAVVLAAGRSRRMGQNKLLLPLEGKVLLAHAVDAALGSRATAVWVVLGAEAEQVHQALGNRPLHFLRNRRWAEGQATSLQEAVAALQQQTTGLIFLAGDMPAVRPEHLDRMIERFLAGATVVWSGEGPLRSIPALFGRESWPALMELEGDMGGRALAGRFEEAIVSTSNSDLLCDVDTPEDYEQILDRHQGRR